MPTKNDLERVTNMLADVQMITLELGKGVGSLEGMRPKEEVEMLAK